METWRIFAKAQEMYTLGITLLSFVLKGTTCVPVAGYAFFNEKFVLTSKSFPVPTGRRTAMTLRVNAPTYNHAVGVIFNNEERTFSFIDSSHWEEHKNPQRVIALLKEAYPTYNYVSIACPREILPQKTDGYCTMWSYFLLTKSCQGVVLREYLRNTPRKKIQEEFMAFIDDLYEEFLVDELYMLYGYYQRTLIGLYLSRDYTHATELNRGFRNSTNQKELLDDYQQYITLPTQVRRSYNQALFLMDILVNISQTGLRDEKGIFQKLANALTIEDVVEIISQEHFGRYLLTELLRRKRRLIELGVLAPVYTSLYNRYYLPYKQLIANEAAKQGVDLNTTYAIATLSKRQYGFLIIQELYAILAGMDYEAYVARVNEVQKEILKDPPRLYDFFSYTLNGGSLYEFVFGQITGNPIFPLPEDTIAIMQRPYIELLFLYHLSIFVGQKDFEPYVNIEDINKIEDTIATKSDITYTLRNTLETLGIDEREYHRIPQELRSLSFRHMLPAHNRIDQFSLLTGLQANKIGNFYIALDESGRQVDTDDLEQRVLFATDPIEKIAAEYLAAPIIDESQQE